MSLDSALSGETYTTMVASGSAPPASTPIRTSSSMAARKAASVLPEPVGAATSVERPPRMDGQARRWASVAEPKDRRNHAATAGWKPCSASTGWRAMVMPDYMGPAARIATTRP